jgi:Fur family transcriptional regulator, peroxide stress response regulator
MDLQADNPTASGAQPTVVAEGLERLRSIGCRLTPQRRAILEIFEGEPKHLTPQQIYGQLQPRLSSLSLATVYNTLELFEEVGIVKRVNARDGQTYFDPTVEPHHHGVCDGCGELFDVHIESDSLHQLLANARTLHEGAAEFRVEQASVWLRGVCATCQG